MIRVLVLLALLLPTAVFAAPQDKCWPSATTSYTLNSVNTTPGTDGIDVRGYDQYLTLNFIKTAGTISTNIEVKMANGDWVAAAGGPLSSNFHGAVNPDRIVIHRVRLNTGTCTGCTAAAVLCSRPNDR